MTTRMPIVWIWTLLLVAALTLASVNAARAQQSSDGAGSIVAGGILLMLNGAMVSSAKKGWAKVGPDVQACLRADYNIDPDQLIKQGTGPGNSKVAALIKTCRDRAAAARVRAEEERALRAQQEADAAAALEKTRKEQAARAAARRSTLVAKFGAAEADAIAAGVVRKGMSKEALLEARGAPKSKEQVGPGEEMWRYGSQTIVLVGGKVNYVSK